MTDIERVLSDLLRASCDDIRLRLPPLAERKLLDRMVELCELMGVTITRPDPEPPPDDDPNEWRW